MATVRAGRLTLDDIRQAKTPLEARQIIRAGDYVGHTTGVVLGYLQVNLAILPESYASDFQRFCQRNPRPCPLAAVSEVGVPRFPTLGEDLDIRSDVPAYNVFRDGKLVDTVTDIAELWQDDFVAFALGCSLTFEQALFDNGLRYRMLDAKKGRRSAVYNTGIECIPAGPFRSKMVCSMRPFQAADAIRAIQITSRFPLGHGAPVHIGDPGLIGIQDIVAEDIFDGEFEIMDDEIPVFWGCGITPQRAIENARPPIAIAHAPGNMLLTDVPSAQTAVF
ncbi:MAG: putative hydro-lyase [Acetobacterales bacterium]